MSSKAKNPVPKIRTFAGDLEEQRKEKGVAKKNTATTRKIPDQKASPAKQTTQGEKTVVTPKPHKPEKEKKPTKEEAPKLAPATEPTHKIVTEAAPQKKEVVEVKKTPEVHTPKKIPAFHEIEKQVKAIDKGTAEGKRPNVGYDAKIITDNKNKRFKLFPSIFAGISNWFKQKKKTKKKAKNEYKIPETSRRKGVIQKATSKTGSDFTDDHGKLKEQIRRRQQLEAEAKINQTETKKEEPDEPETVWTPYTDSGYDLLEAENPVKNVQVEFRKKTFLDPTPEPKPEASPAPIAPPPDVTPVEKEAPEVKPEPVAEPAPIEEVVTAEPPTPEPKPAEPQEVAVPETEEVPEEEPAPKERIDGQNSELEKLDTNTMAVVTLIAIIGAVVIIIVSRIIFQYITGSANEPVPQTEVGPSRILDDSILHSITLEPSNVTQLPAMVDSVVLGANGNTTEIIIVDVDGQELEPALILELLDLDTTPALNQSLSAIRFVASGSDNESIVLTFTDETAVRGGLLRWENSMARDLQSLYNLDIESIEEARFVDRMIAGYDTRLLGTEERALLIYSIIDDNTALISTNQSDFRQIVEFGLQD